jgi:hypothetical protein
MKVEDNHDDRTHSTSSTTTGGAWRNELVNRRLHIQRNPAGQRAIAAEPRNPGSVGYTSTTGICANCQERYRAHERHHTSWTG